MSKGVTASTDWVKILNYNAQITRDDKKQRFFKLLSALCEVGQLDNKTLTLRPIPSLMQALGSDFTQAFVEGNLLGMQILYGYDLIQVLVTHDLSSCVIKDIPELINRIRLELDITL